MKYHKIRNVNFDVCTAEQKIAYNVAFRIFTNHSVSYEEQKVNCSESEISNYIHDLIRMHIGYLTDDGVGKRYNLDAVFCCLNAGLRVYIDGRYHIFTSYYEIGRAFPAYYLAEYLQEVRR